MIYGSLQGMQLFVWNLLQMGEKSYCMQMSSIPL